LGSGSPGEHLFDQLIVGQRQGAVTARVIGRLVPPAFKIAGPMPALEALRFCAKTIPHAVLVHAGLRDISAEEFCLLLQRRANGTPCSTLLFGRPRRPPREEAPGPPAIDSYLSERELEHAPARIRSLIEHAMLESGRPVAHYEGRHLRARFDRVEVFVDEHPIDLTRRELELLQFLVSFPNRLLSRPDILSHVWRNENDGRSRTVDVHVRRLRLKLGSAGEQIQTVTGVGYRFSEK
jgi:hypothetical protein